MLKETTANESGEDGGVEERIQIKSRARVRDLAEVYTHRREVEAMLDLVGDMLPSEERPLETDRTFLEPACGSGNFLEEVLRRKLAFVTSRRFRVEERYEHWILRCLASIYGIDISEDNVLETRTRLRVLVNAHVDNDLNTSEVSTGFERAVETILTTNVVRADSLRESDRIELVDYKPKPRCTFLREWFLLDQAANAQNLFAARRPRRDEVPIHYSELSRRPRPARAPKGGGVGG